MKACHPAFMGIEGVENRCRVRNIPRRVRNISRRVRKFSSVENFFPSLEKIFSSVEKLFSSVGKIFSRLGFFLKKHLGVTMCFPERGGRRCGADNRYLITPPSFYLHRGVFSRLFQCVLSWRIGKGLAPVRMEADFQPASVRKIAHKSFLSTNKKETSLPVFALPYLYGENLQGGWGMLSVKSSLCSDNQWLHKHLARITHKVYVWIPAAR